MANFEAFLCNFSLITNPQIVRSVCLSSLSRFIFSKYSDMMKFLLLLDSYVIDCNDDKNIDKLFRSFTELNEIVSEMTVSKQL